MRCSRPIEILLVEDSPGDIRLTREALRDTKITNRPRAAIENFWFTIVELPSD